MRFVSYAITMVVAFAGATLMVSPASAEVINLIAMKDNTLYETASGSLSNGKGQSFFAGRTLQSQNSIRRGLLAFDVAGAVPAGSTIVSVTLSLYCAQTISGDEPVSLHRTLQNWGEGTSNAGVQGGSGAPASVGDATWLHTFRPSGFWASPGGDFDPAASATTLVGLAGFVYEWGSPLMNTEVQSWLDNPGQNFGWTLLGNEINDGSAKRFATRETTDIFATKPTLTIEYNIPEPGSAGLLAACLIMIFRRYRAEL